MRGKTKWQFRNSYCVKPGGAGNYFFIFQYLSLPDSVPQSVTGFTHEACARWTCPPSSAVGPESVSSDGANILNTEQHIQKSTEESWGSLNRCCEDAVCVTHRQAGSPFARVAKMALLNKCSRWAESDWKVSLFALHSFYNAKQKIPMPKHFISSIFIASLQAASFWTCCNPICSC